MRSLLCLLIFLPGTTSAFAETRFDVEYARTQGSSLKLDAYLPNGTGSFPAAIIVHGGGYTGGDKRKNVAPLFDPLVKAGFTVFSISYRLAPKHRHPAPVEDIRSAIQYVRSHAKEYKVDSQRIVLIGESAGGSLASLVGAQNNPDAQVAAVISFYAAYDQEARTRQAGKLADSHKLYFGLTELNDQAYQTLREASALHYVKKGLPPFLLLHGTEDQVVAIEQSVMMCERLKNAGNRCDLITVKGAGHGINGAEWEKHSVYKEKMIDWLKKILLSTNR